MQKKKFKIYSPKFKEECGIFGISNYEDASALTALGLHALQHRGQEGCGIVSYDGSKYYSEKRYGLVGSNNKVKVNSADVSFHTDATERMTIKDSTGNVGIGKTSPTKKLEVEGDISASGDYFSPKFS